MSQKKEQKVNLDMILLIVVMLVPNMTLPAILPFEGSMGKIVVAASLSALSAGLLSLIKTPKGKIAYTIILVMVCFTILFVFARVLK